MSAAVASHAASARVEQPPHRLHCRDTALHHVGERRRSAEDAVGVGKAHPFVREGLAMKNVEGLEDADQKGDAQQLVGVEHPPLRVLLHLVIRAVADAAEEPARLLVAHMPAVDQVEECLERRRTQPLTLLTCCKVDDRRWVVSCGGIAQASHGKYLLFRTKYTMQ